MRNYWVSISIHIVILLLMLFPFLTNSSDKLELDQVVLIDFSDQNNRPKQVNQTRTKSPEPNRPSPPKTVNPKSAVPKTAKRIEQKPVVASPSAANPTKPAVDLRAPTREEKDKTAEAQALEAWKKKEAERKKKLEDEKLAKELKEEKIEAFSTLFKEAGQGETETLSEEKQGPSKSLRSDVSGSLGNRVVLRKPVIKDDSQKYGRVVVKICVAADGRVISSDFTQIGSTTSDPYLIQLAEKGAMGYLFSISENPKECGKVVIDFELK